MGTGTMQAQATHTGPRLTGSRFASAALLAAAGVCASTAQAQPAGFWLTGKAPGGTGSQLYAVSADGRLAGGLTRGVPGGSLAMLWTRESGRQDIAPPPGFRSIVVESLTGDGSMAAGTMASGFGGDGATIFRRRPDGAVQEIGTLPGYERAATGRISRDGRTVAGVARRGTGPDQESMPFRWTEGGTGEALGVLPNNQVFAETRGVSADGRTIVGLSTDGFASNGWVWREGQGLLSLSVFAGTGTSAAAVSGDGRFVAGSVDTPDGLRAARFDLVTGQTLRLPALTDYRNFQAEAVSDDGRTIAGLASRGSGQDAFVWREGEGMFFLRDYLAMNGVGVPADFSFFFLRAISADGRTFAGSGGVWNVSEQGFVATVPAPSALLLLAPAGAIAYRRRR
jgi:uncharacterized membrane protein